MTTVRIRPGPVSGAIRAPGSKSYTHRALVVGHLSGRRFRIRRPLASDDTVATALAMTRLGTPVHRRPDAWQVEPESSGPSKAPTVIDCGESGTTLRFASALAGLRDRKVRIVGATRLSERPIDELLRALNVLGAKCRHVRRKGLPIEVVGPITGGRVTLDASQSSQFASALLLALPTLEGDSEIEMLGKVVSEPYLDATLAVLSHHGVIVDRRGRSFRIPGKQRFRGTSFGVPGDASSAAYLWAAAAVAGGSVRVDGVPSTWPQADLAVLDLLELAGATVVRRVNEAAVTGARRKPFRVDLTRSPDLYPLAGVLAATTEGVSRIVGAEHVALKESDRKGETAFLARQLGAKVESSSSDLRIEGTLRPRALHVRHLTDHRVVMSAAVGALAGDGESVIGDRNAVRKSFPGFWSALRAVSGEVRSS